MGWEREREKKKSWKNNSIKKKRGTEKEKNAAGKKKKKRADKSNMEQVQQFGGQIQDLLGVQGRTHIRSNKLVGFSVVATVGPMPSPLAEYEGR